MNGDSDVTIAGDRVTRLAIRFPSAQLEALDQLVAQGRYASRSDAIRKAIRNLQESWQAWGDSVDRFIDECVARDPDAPPLTTGSVHQRYVLWCRVVDEDPVGQHHFTTILKGADVGYGRHKIDGITQRGYAAIRLSEDVPTPIE